MISILKNVSDFITANQTPAFAVLEDDLERREDLFNHNNHLEKRNSSRMSVIVPVWYRVRHRLARWISTRSSNHSSTGIRLALPLGTKMGSEIDLKMQIPNMSHHLSLRGVVIWISPVSVPGQTMVECGVAFKDLRRVSNKEKLIFFMADKFCDSALQTTKHLHNTPVQSLTDLKTCFQTVYKTYLPRGYCSENPHKVHYTYYCFLPKTRTFILKEKEEVLGTITLVVDSPCGLPMDTLFSQELNELRARGRVLAEAGLLATLSTPTSSKKFSLTNAEKQTRFFRTIKIMFEYILFEAGVTDLIIGVHPKHETLYQFLRFKHLGPVRKYPGANGNPALLLHLDMLKVDQNWPAGLKNFIFEDRSSEQIMRSNIVFDKRQVRHFLFDQLPLWHKMPPSSREYLKECYPGL